MDRYVALQVAGVICACVAVFVGAGLSWGLAATGLGAVVMGVVGEMNANADDDDTETEVPDGAGPSD